MSRSRKSYGNLTNNFLKNLVTRSTRGEYLGGYVMVEILTECVAVPFSAIKNALNKMEYASTVRTIFLMLCISGCRLHAIETMRLCMLQDGTLYFLPGKNQRKYLKVKLPDWYLVELAEYRRTHRVNSDHLFGASSESFRRYFLKEREHLGSEWLEKVFYPEKKGFHDGYKLQLKGIRKTVATKTFHDEFVKWKDAGVALEMTSKKYFAHKNCSMTAYHYLREFEQLGLKPEKKECTLVDELINEDQRTILEYI